MADKNKIVIYRGGYKGKTLISLGHSKSLSLHRVWWHPLNMYYFPDSLINHVVL